MLTPLPGGPRSLGAPAPDIDLTDPHGRRVTLREFRGQSLLLVFFPDGWDPTRRQQIELYDEIARSTPGAANVLGVSYDGTWCELEVDADDAVRFPLLNDSAGDSAAARRFGVAGCHAAFIIDAAGMVRWRHVAPMGTQPQVDELREALVEALEPRAGGLRLSRREFLMGAVAASLLAAAVTPRLARA